MEEDFSFQNGVINLGTEFQTSLFGHPVYEFSKKARGS